MGRIDALQQLIGDLVYISKNEKDIGCVYQIQAFQPQLIGNFSSAPSLNDPLDFMVDFEFC